MAVAAVATRAGTTVPPEIVHNAQVRSQAEKSFLQGKSAEALVYLAANLRNTQGPDNRVEIAQQLVSIAFSLHNKRQYEGAREVGSEALRYAAALTSGSGLDGHRSSLLVNLGTLAEVVLHDPNTAHGLYQAALIAQPSNAQAQDALRQIEAKLNYHVGLKH